MRSGSHAIDHVGTPISRLKEQVWERAWRASMWRMSSSDQVRALLDRGHTYETSARELGISPGLAYMLGTGVPADSSDDLHADERAGRPELADSSQRLVNPRHHNPDRDPVVIDSIKRRAATELTGSHG